MRFGGIVLAALLTLGACSSDPQPKEPKRTATSATPTATPPTMPAQAKEDTPEGAAAFVKHYIATFNFAARTGDTQLMIAAAPRCKPCNQYANDFRKLKNNATLADDDVWTIKDLAVGPTRDPIEIDAEIAVLDEGMSSLTFVLNSKAPFEIRSIYMRDN
jgi:hypothetical protein